MHWNTQHHKLLLLKHSERLLSFLQSMHHKSRVSDKTQCIERHNMDNIPQQYLGKYATHSCFERFMVFDPKCPLWLRCLKFDPFITTEQRSQCAEQWVCSLTKTRDQSSQYLTTGHWLTPGGGVPHVAHERSGACGKMLTAVISAIWTNGQIWHERQMSDPKANAKFVSRNPGSHRGSSQEWKDALIIWNLLCSQLQWSLQSIKEALWPSGNRHWSFSVSDRSASLRVTFPK